jgi:hypothetical protein
MDIQERYLAVYDKIEINEECETHANLSYEQAEKITIDG